MVGIHGKLSKANELIEEGEKIVNEERVTSVDKLDTKLVNITRLTTDLINSKKELFFKEANFIYSPDRKKKI